MSVRDINSNFKIVAGEDLAPFTTKPVWATKPIDLSVGPTAYVEMVFPSDDAVINNVAIRFTQESGNIFDDDQLNIDTLSTADIPELGNFIIDLNTGLAPIFPIDLSLASTSLAVNIVNPVGTNRYAIIVLNETLDVNASVVCAAFAGPLRYVTGE